MFVSTALFHGHIEFFGKESKTKRSVLATTIQGIEDFSSCWCCRLFALLFFWRDGGLLAKEDDVCDGGGVGG